MYGENIKIILLTIDHFNHSIHEFWWYPDTEDHIPPSDQNNRSLKIQINPQFHITAKADICDWEEEQWKYATERC